VSATEQYNRLLAEQAIRALAERNIEGWYFDDREEAVRKALLLIPDDGTSSCGGSETLKEIGLREALNAGGYRFLDPLVGKSSQEMESIARKAMSADCYFMSANAIAATGEMVNIDGYGNRVAALIFGPKRVVVMAGINKVVSDLHAAMNRAKTIAAAKCVTLFREDFSAMDDMRTAAELAQSHIVITKRSALPGRIFLILIGEELGF
jgi:L-lactate utilization protein LutB